MQKVLWALISVILLSLFAANIVYANEPTDDQVRKILIRDSLAKYPGNCPCPYNTDRAGRKCGKRSAYSKPGGYAPLCYSQDVTDEMVERYRKSN